MIRDAEQSQQDRMSQFEQSQFSDLANFTQNVLDSALADSLTTVSVYTTQNITNQFCSIHTSCNK